LELGSQIADKLIMPANLIFLLDPFKNLLNAYRMILEEEKYLVETSTNLQDAYELLKGKQYSVMIIEYIPPFEATNDMIRWVRRSAPETYIIMVTNASIDEKTYEKLFDMGLDDLVLKPYAPEKILVHIKKGLRQRDLILKVQRLERLSILDPITQDIEEAVFNTIFFKKCFRQELKKSKRHQHPFSLLLIQIPTKGKIGDRFNSFYMELAKIIRRFTREEDMVGKSNGEIGVILPETNEIGSQAVMQRLSSLIQAHSALKPYVQALSFRSFTYPNQFGIPEPLKTVLEEVNREYLPA
jgi:diguanylate cyclase (GGDEF)-like protein